MILVKLCGFWMSWKRLKTGVLECVLWCFYWCEACEMNMETSGKLPLVPWDPFNSFRLLELLEEAPSWTEHISPSHQWFFAAGPISVGSCVGWLPALIWLGYTRVITGHPVVATNATPQWLLNNFAMLNAHRWNWVTLHLSTRGQSLGMSGHCRKKRSTQLSPRPYWMEVIVGEYPQTTSANQVGALFCELYPLVISHSYGNSQ
jgi:hypothetical protein